MNVQRTCSDIAAEDCQTVNKIHYCYCSRPLCNGQNAESIIENLGDKLGFNDDDEDDSVNAELEEGSGSHEDDDVDSHQGTSQKTDQIGSTATEGREFEFTVATMSSAHPTTNEAVNFNLSRNLSIFWFFARLIAVCY